MIPLASKFKRTPISNVQFLIECITGSFFSLRLFEFYESEEQLLEILTSIDPNTFCCSYFILSDSLSHWIPKILSRGAFDVIIGSVRYNEFNGKLEHFFSEENQASLLKKYTNKYLDLTKKEQQLFDFLVAHPRGITRDQLMTKCWKNVSVHPKTLDVHLFNLRQKLEAVGGAVGFRNGSWHLYFNSHQASHWRF